MMACGEHAISRSKQVDFMIYTPVLVAWVYRISVNQSYGNPILSPLRYCYIFHTLDISQADDLFPLLL